MEHLHYDKRLLDHYINTGKISKKDYEKLLKELKDESSNTEIIDIDEFLASDKEQIIDTETK